MHHAAAQQSQKADAPVRLVPGHRSPENAPARWCQSLSQCSPGPPFYGRIHLSRCEHLLIRLAEPSEDLINMASQWPKQHLSLPSELEIDLVASLEHEPITDLFRDGYLTFTCKRCDSHSTDLLT